MISRRDSVSSGCCRACSTAARSWGCVGGECEGAGGLNATSQDACLAARRVVNRQGHFCSFGILALKHVRPVPQYAHSTRPGSGQPSYGASQCEANSVNYPALA